jgi:hypothetical protein
VVGSRSVADKDTTPAERVAAEMAKKSVRSSVVTYALWRVRSETDAEDLVGEAILCASDPDRKPWDPAKRAFFKHMRYLMDDLAIERACTRASLRGRRAPQDCPATRTGATGVGRVARRGGRWRGPRRARRRAARGGGVVSHGARAPHSAGPSAPASGDDPSPPASGPPASVAPASLFDPASSCPPSGASASGTASAPL